ncbi:Crp/Fnr family transcriptional regulator [Fibrella forsythiae]|uniref:Crp/Fnr family transcriptional regulator n=1 Tax=Fibrella forsythiae TaxID=2817061 RepID=A0ABS3JFP9_9BACT|nr:Crp/Fnr family transcriptional regulator [Fibrella forsythiae]MBO0948831.1 Crp/Fnr family transcriptional regulator [Fibrella forsythiae]
MFRTLQSIVPELFSASTSIDMLMQLTRKQQLPRGTLLVREGQKTDQLFFLESGMARAYFYENENEITSWIIVKNGFAIAPHSFFNQEPSSENIELLAPSTVFSIQYDDLQRLYADFPLFNQVGRKIMEHYVLQYEWRIRILRTRSAEKRYDMFEQQFGPILVTAQGRHVASFLGMTASTLSRLRSKRMRKK